MILDLVQLVIGEDMKIGDAQLDIVLGVEEVVAGRRRVLAFGFAIGITASAAWDKLH